MKSGITLLAALIVLTPCCLLKAGEVSINDFGGKVVLIGKLGKPLGTVFSVEGQIASEPKRAKSARATAVLRVNKVDGKRLDKSQIIAIVFPASMDISAVHTSDLVSVSGYEGGAFVGTPDAARDSLGKDASPTDFKFEPLLNIVKIENAAGASK